LPVEVKPLFRPDVLRPYLKAFALSPAIEGRRATLAKWAELLASGRADDFKEQELLADFLADVFRGILGYASPADCPERFTISRQKHVQVDGKYADAVLGNFRSDNEQFIVALEGKGPRDPLERPFAGRRMSAVDQGYRYAINLPCDWVIVTSMRQTRLYYKGCDQQTYERFDIDRLAADDGLLRKFVFLLGAERVVPAVSRCHLYALRESSETTGRDLTKKFYVQYANMRQDAFGRLCQKNPAVAPKAILACTQKVLDRILFCAFCEDRGLLPPDTITKAYQHRDPYRPRPIWENFCGLFQAINEGNETLGIPAYNGGLFAPDAVLERIQVPDAVCDYFRDLGQYDYRPAHEAAIDAEEDTAGTLVDVDILGHIFEQSITDLEKIRAELEEATAPLDAEKHKSRRKKEGAFYTPAFITRYNVRQALGGVLRDRFERLRHEHHDEAKTTARAVLEDPGIYQLDKLTRAQREGLIRFWEAWQDQLVAIRLLDPACGSGAFLIESFDQLHTAYEVSNDHLQELRGHRTLFDLDKQILQNNLYGVDLNEEAIEICRLSLWIKTAQRGKALTSLDRNIRVGNSVVDDPAVDPKAFDWRAAFPEVFANGGFDVVVANPPYVRQELLGPIKPHLQARFQSYHGMADLYVYFYELALNLLRPGGRLSFIVTNKWMKSGYGEPLRRFFGKHAWMESVVDFGHAKQIFEDADVFPCIIVARKPDENPRPATRVCAIPREQLRIDDLGTQIEREGFEIDATQLGAEPWQLEPGGVAGIVAKIRERGVPLAEFAGVKPYRGILTGFNDAFLIDTITKNALVAADARSADLIRPYVRGQDIARWNADWAGLWMIALKSSENHPWPWANNSEQAEAIFAQTYPALHAHMNQFREPLIKRQDQGRYWWELRSCAYWQEFAKPKIVYQEIQYHPSYAMDSSGKLGNNKTFFVACGDLYLLAVLNSPLLWWHNWRYLPHMKDEALSPVAFLMETLPIARPTDEIRLRLAANAQRLVEMTAKDQSDRQDLLDWLRIEHSVEKPSMKLQSPASLDSDAFVAEVKKLRGKKNPLSAAALKNLREEYARTIEPLRALAAEAVGLEHEISQLVNTAYGLTDDEVRLMWQTAPPRMPTPPGQV
jgi:hypothetical protein